MVALMGLSLTACSDGDDLNTDQYGNEISLNSFGPCPVLRGGTLYFYGVNLDQITEIDIPGADPITAINVITSGQHSQISIQVPAEKCDTGLVTLVTAKGGQIKSVTPITYREDITLSDLYIGQQGNLAGNVGDVVTIKGDYLNLMHGVIFAGNDTVREAEFVTHDRYTIQVKIPESAASGKLILTDLAVEPAELETEDAITITLPTVTKLTPTDPKAGQTITITGTQLNLIAAVVLPNNVTIEAEDFTTHSATTIAFNLPETVGDGEVSLTTKSGVQIPAGNIITVVPGDLSTAPAPVKNGKEITISGKDLDLVTGIAFPNADGTLKSVAATKVVAVVPETAQEGDITLTLANGKTVTVAYTLVKPVVTGVNPATVMAGNKIMLRGTDLDLVVSVTFPGESPVTADDAIINATAIGVTVPASAVGSGCTLNLKNGNTVSVSGLTITAATDPVLSEPAEGVLGENVTVNGKNFNNVEQIFIGETKVTKVISRGDNAMTFQIPATVAAGTYDLIFVGPDGTRYVGGKIIVNAQEIDLWTGSAGPIAWDGTGTVAIADKASLLEPGYTLGFDFTPTPGSYYQIRLMGTWWTELPSFQAIYTDKANNVKEYKESDTGDSFVLTQADIDIIAQQGLLFAGNGLTITRVYYKK